MYRSTPREKDWLQILALGVCFVAGGLMIAVGVWLELPGGAKPSAAATPLPDTMQSESAAELADGWLAHELQSRLSSAVSRRARVTSAKSSPAVSSVARGPKPANAFLPILFWHHPPPNLNDQLTYLEQSGYTVIDMDEAWEGMQGGSLPAKPVVLTFDDGFATQMEALPVLQAHHMKATFYIITGGVDSQWCIGASRRFGDPLQPPDGCGDAYLTWDQIRSLEATGLITIGGHTMNHLNLMLLSDEAQRREIADGKTEIEQQLGHPIHHLAYPYGAYNDVSRRLAREAGYLTATTVNSGDYQPAGSEFELRRLRDAMALP